MVKNPSRSRRPEAARERRHGDGLRRFALPVLLALVQVVAVPGLDSVYRLPKDALAAAGLALIVGASLVVAVWRGSLQVPRGGLVVVLVALPVAQLASAFWSASPLRAAAIGATTVIWVAAAVWLSQRSQEERDRALRFASLGAVTSGAVVFLQHLGIPLFDFLGSGRRTLTGLAGNPSDLAIGSALLVPLLMAGVRPVRSSLTRLLLPAFLVATVVASQSLTGVIAVAAFAVAWAWPSGSRRARLATITLLAAAALTIIVTDPGGRISKLLFQVQEGRWYNLVSAREDGWTAAVEMIAQHPIGGVGAGNYTHWYYPSRLRWLEAHDLVGGRGELATHFSWAHCDPLQLGAELGLLGWGWLAALVAVLVRFRSDATARLFAVALVPFALAHYPTQLAVGAVPILLVLATLLSRLPASTLEVRPLAVRAVAAVVVAALALTTLGWQAKRVALSAFRNNVEGLLQAVDAAPAEQRAKPAGQVERQCLATMPSNPGAAAWLLRSVGKARFLAGNAGGAADAFRGSWQVWPHEEAEFGLGLALAAAGHRQEALVHLGRVCRVNPALARLIADPDLRSSVRILTSRRAQRADQP